MSTIKALLYITFGFSILTGITACSSDSDTPVPVPPPSVSTVTTTGSYTTSLAFVPLSLATSRAVVNYTLVWTADGSTISGTYQDDLFAITPVDVTGTISTTAFNIDIALDTAVAGVESINFSVASSVFLASSVSVDLNDNMGTPLETVVATTSTESDTEIDDYTEDFVGTYSGRVLSSVGTGCEADNTEIQITLAEVEEYDTADLEFRIPATSPTVTPTVRLTHMINMTNYYQVIATSEEPTPDVTYVGIVSFNEQTQAYFTMGEVTDTPSGCTYQIEADLQ